MRERTYTRRQALGILAGIGLTGVLASCGSGSQDSSSASTDASASDAAADKVTVRVASLKGPTTIGLVHMMDTTSGIPTEGEASPSDSSSSDADGITYSYTMSSAPDEVLPLVINGDADIALIPSNAAAVLYNKTSGGVKVIDVNTLGVLSVVTGDSSIQSFGDLAGHTVYLSGQGASPEYTLNYLLDQAQIRDQVTIEWKSEHAEVASVLAADPTAIGILPEPFTTATLAQNSALSAPVSLTEVWDSYAGDSGSKFVMAATVVRSDFASQHPAAVKDFLDKHAASVQFTKDDVDATAALVVKAGIVAKEPIAKAAIPKCNVVCLTGDEMKDALDGYLKVLYDADASSVGGSLPGDDLYYQGA